MAKFVQIAANDGKIVGLDDAGGLWRLSGDEWRPMPSHPSQAAETPSIVTDPEPTAPEAPPTDVPA